jgi:hypothetical protein
MKNTIATILFLFLAVSVNAQDSLRTENSDTLKFEIKDLSKYFDDSTFTITLELPECPYNKLNAKKDIEKDSMSVIIHGGFKGFGNIDENLCAEFQKKYNVKFVFLGCLRYWNTESEDTYGYNEIIFAHLERTYGAVVNTEFEQIWIEK